MKTKRTVIGFLLAVVFISPFSLGVQALTDNHGNVMSQVSDFAGSGEFGEANGAADAASFRNPERVAIGPDGSVYISDTYNQLIRKVKDGQATVLAGTTIAKNEAGLPIGSLVDGKGDQASFWSPQGIDVDAQGNVYVADSGNHAVRKISQDGTVTTLAGNGILGDQDGTGKEASFYGPQDVAVAADGTVYVADTLNHVIRKITKDGVVTTLNAKSDRVVEVLGGYVLDGGDYADGALADAKFNEPTGLALDSKGNLYVSDAGNQLIRYIDFVTNKVITVAGKLNNPAYPATELYATVGYVNGKASEAQFNFPKGIAFTSEGGLVIADSLNHAIRYLLDGEVTTIAGSSVESYGDQNGINGHSLLHSPSGVAVREDGSILIADVYNNQAKLLSFYSHPAGLKADGSIHVVVNGSLIEFDAEPELSQNRTMIPARAVSEAFGYQVDYKDNQALIRNQETTVTLTVGSNVLAIEDDQGTRNVTIDAAPYIKDNRTYVPLRFFSEQFGLDVQWDQAARTAVIRDKVFE